MSGRVSARFPITKKVARARCSFSVVSSCGVERVGFLWVLVRSKAWGDDRGEEAAGADGLERNFGISLRSLRLGKRTVLTTLSPYHGRSVWNRGREHRIVTGARTFPSAFGMTDMQWREDADLADSGASGLRVVLVLLRSTKRSLSEGDLATELPCFLTVKSFPWSHVRLAVWDPGFGRLRA